MKLITAIHCDLPEVFIEEILQFVAFCKLRLCFTPSQQAISFVDQSLRILLCLMVTHCSGERTLSKLGVIKNYLRTNMTHGRLSDLCLSDVDSSVLKQYSLNNLLKIFFLN